MPTRNVVLTAHHEKLIADLVASGRYRNASEVLREGLRLVEARESREAAKLKALREAARAGLADFEAGRFREIEDGAVEEMLSDLGRRARTVAAGTLSLEEWLARLADVPEISLSVTPAEAVRAERGSG